MILLLGASGYIGEAFARELSRRALPFESLSRKAVDYTDFETFRQVLTQKKPEFVINAAGFTGKPNVDACETARAETLLGNSLLPQVVGNACAAAGVAWGHVSSGCIFSGAKVVIDGKPRIERDMTKPELRRIIEQNADAIHGFTEEDEPNFSFRSPPCSFYSGAKALGEEAIAKLPKTYVWRLRIPFDEFDNGRNYLSKVQRYSKAYDNVNSISHRGEFVSACLDLWQGKASFGTYNVTNPGFVTTREVIRLIEKILKPGRKFEFWASDEEFYRVAAKTPRSNCVLDTTKLVAAGVKLRPVQEALEYCLNNWKPEPT